MFIDLSSLDGELDAELVGRVRGVTGWSDEVPVELEERGVLEAGLELLHRVAHRILNVGQHTVEEGLEGVAWVVRPRAADCKDNVFLAAP